jgi:hypothetical protein
MNSINHRFSGRRLKKTGLFSAAASVVGADFTLLSFWIIYQDYGMIKKGNHGLLTTSFPTDRKRFILKELSSN